MVIHYLKFLFGTVFLLAAIWAGVSLANGHIRSDTVTGFFGLNDQVCVGGDQTAHYIYGRYVTFPETDTRSFSVGGSSFSPDPPLLGCNNLNNQTYITIIELPFGNPTIICLWASNPLPTYDCRDTTPPVQSNITAGSITQTSATITWTTDESATHTIKYGTTSGSYDTYSNTKSAGSGTSASGAL